MLCDMIPGETEIDVYLPQLKNIQQVKVWTLNQIQLGAVNQMSFISVTCRSLDEGLLTGTGLTQRQLCHQNPTLPWVTSHENWIPGALCITSRELDRLESISSRQLCWFEPGSLIDMRMSHTNCIILKGEEPHAAV